MYDCVELRIGFLHLAHKRINRAADSNVKLEPLHAFICAHNFFKFFLSAPGNDYLVAFTMKHFSQSSANTGTATHAVKDGKNILTLSDDFKVPGTPDPHWQVVDSKGTTYLLQKLTIKGDKVNRSITLPAYVSDVSKVQIWCAFAEVVLGEASFQQPVQVSRR